MLVVFAFIQVVFLVIREKLTSIIHLKSYKSMRYDISKRKAPEMPNLGKGTECIKLLLSQASKDMHDPLVPMFSLFLAHTSAAQNFSILTAVGRKCAA